MKSQTWSFAPTQGIGKGIGHRRPQPGLRCSLASSTPAHPAAAEQRIGSEGERERLHIQPEMATGAQRPATSPSGRNAALVCFSRRRFVLGTAGRSPPGTAAGPSKLLASQSSTISRCRFHTTFAQTPEDVDSAESFLDGESDPKRQGSIWPSFDAQSGSGCEMRKQGTYNEL